MTIGLSSSLIKFYSSTRGRRLNLDSAVEDAKSTQSLEPESLLMGAAFTFWECSAPIKSDSDSRSCIALAS